MPKKTKSKYKAKILEKSRILHAELELLSQILQECQHEEDEEQEDK